MFEPGLFCHCVTVSLCITGVLRTIMMGQNLRRRLEHTSIRSAALPRLARYSHAVLNQIRCICEKTNSGDRPRHSWRKGSEGPPPSVRSYCAAQGETIKLDSKDPAPWGLHSPTL